jgi:tripartite-type tricarboxylate transporter receptor subunit TctC
MSEFSRRNFIRLGVGIASLSASTWGVGAQAYPTRPPRIVSGFPPGGINDTYARLIGQWLSERLGQQFVVENRTGAGGTIAAESVARATPDGYTLLLTTSADAWNSSLYVNAKFNLVRDFTPVASIARGASVLVVHPSVAAKSAADLIALTRSNPGKITVASAGIGSTPHMCWELFRSLSGVNMVHVPYRGSGPAVTDLIAGQVLTYFGSMAAVIEHIKAVRLRALAVTTATRITVLPDVPPLAETLPGYDASIFVGLSVPRDTPADIVDRLNREVNTALADPTFLQRIANFGDVPLSLSRSAFAKLAAEESEKWAKVIRAGNIRAE